MWDLNRISDQVLIGVVKYGVIEDVLAKERISKRIGDRVSSVVSKRRRFTTDCDPDWTGTPTSKSPRPQLTMNDVINVLKRMPLLTNLSGLGIGNWDLDQTQQLAVVNPNIVCFNRDCIDPQKVLKYIEYVKELHPDYNGSRVMFTFFPYDDDYQLLVQRFPDLQLKLEVSAYGSKERNPDTIGFLSFWRSGDKLPHNVIFPNVRKVQLGSDYELLNELASLPNLENITIYFVSSSQSKNSLRLSELYPYLGSNLRHVTISTHKLQEWSNEDMLPLKAIIDNIPLKSLKINYVQHFPTRAVLQFVIDSPIGTLEELLIPELDIEMDEKGRTNMSVYQEFIVRLNDMEQLTDLIRKFKKVNYVSIRWSEIEGHQPLDVEGIQESFRQFQMTDRRRKLDLRIVHVN